MPRISKNDRILNMIEYINTYTTLEVSPCDKINVVECLNQKDYELLIDSCPEFLNNILKLLEIKKETLNEFKVPQSFKYTLNINFNIRRIKDLIDGKTWKEAMQKSYD